VIRHERPGVDAPASLEAGLIEAAEKGALGAVRGEDRSAIVAAVDDVVAGVFGLETKGAGHALERGAWLRKAECGGVKTPLPRRRPHTTQPDPLARPVLKQNWREQTGD